MSDSAEPHCEIEFTEPGLVSPVDCEAERLRKQQMAIEKEVCEVYFNRTGAVYSIHIFLYY